jgi:hypothetical protein
MNKRATRQAITAFAALGISLLFGIPATYAAPVELLTNGGFETADFSGWSIFEQGGSALLVDNTATSPVSGFATVGPSSGNYYAVADGALGETALIQNFTTHVGSMGTLRFDMFVASAAPFIVDPSGLDHTTGGSFDANQHARVDLLVASADPFSADVLASYYLDVDGPLDPANPYQSYSFDVSDVTGLGGAYQLRFAQVNNQDFLIQGIDNVSVTVDGAPISAPFTLSLFGIGLLAFYTARSRKPFHLFKRFQLEKIL